jgi:hypothetical protein
MPILFGLEGTVAASTIADLATAPLSLLTVIYTAATGNPLLSLFIGVAVIGVGCAAFRHVRHTVR